MALPIQYHNDTHPLEKLSTDTLNTQQAAVMQRKPRLRTERNPRTLGRTGPEPGGQGAFRGNEGGGVASLYSTVQSGETGGSQIRGY